MQAALRHAIRAELAAVYRAQIARLDERPATKARALAGMPAERFLDARRIKASHFEVVLVFRLKPRALLRENLAGRRANHAERAAHRVTAKGVELVDRAVEVGPR